MKVRAVLQKVSFMIGLILVSIPAVYAAHRYDQLSNGQKQFLHDGKQLMSFFEIDHEMWPRAKIQQIVHATPEEAFAVVTDFKRRSEYFFRVLESVPTLTHDPKVVLVDYRMKIPAFLTRLFNPNYRVREQIQYLDEDRGYQICWNLVASKTLERMDGCSWFEAIPGGSTLITYEIQMRPVSHSFLFKTRPVVAAIKRGGGESLQSVVDRIEQVKMNQPDLLAEEILELREKL